MTAASSASSSSSSAGRVYSHHPEATQTKSELESLKKSLTPTQLDFFNKVTGDDLVEQTLVCRMVYEIMPVEITNSGSLKEGVVVPTSLLNIFTAKLEAYAETWLDDTLLENPNFITPPVAHFIFSWSLHTILEFVERNHFDRTMSFSALLRKNFEMNPRLDVRNEEQQKKYYEPGLIFRLNSETMNGFVSTLVFYFGVFEDVVMYSNEVERIIEKPLSLLEYRNHTWQGPLLYDMDKTIVKELIQHNLEHPHPTFLNNPKDKILSMEQTTFTPAAFGIYAQSWIDLGIMIYAFNEPILQHTDFSSVHSFILEMRKKFPLAGHNQYIRQLGEFLGKLNSFHTMPGKEIRKWAENFYKTWWFTQNQRTSYSSVYDDAIEWHVVDHLIERRETHVPMERMLEVIREEMLTSYPSCPFNTARAQTLISRYQLLHKKVVNAQMDIPSAAASATSLFSYKTLATPSTAAAPKPNGMVTSKPLTTHLLKMESTLPITSMSTATLTHSAAAISTCTTASQSSSSLRPRPRSLLHLPPTSGKIPTAASMTTHAHKTSSYAPSYTDAMSDDYYITSTPKATPHSNGNATSLLTKVSVSDGKTHK